MDKRGKKIYPALLSAVLLLSGCISDYEHPDIRSGESLLVVEGFITDHTTTIKLSQSVGLTEELASAPPVRNAEVWVETDGGGRMIGYADYKTGIYHVETGELDANTEYRLRIVLDGKEYASEFLKPVFTPPVSGIDSYKKEKGEPIQILLSTQGDPSGSPYYKWEYEEIWEVHPPLYANAYLEDPPWGTPIISSEYNGHTPYYYAWKYARSNSIYVGNTSAHSENRIEKLKLFEVEPDDDRFMSLYYINVRQNSLRRESYEYFSQLKTDMEEIGSIFAPVPSELKGNITCTSDPDIPVIGYVEVSTTTEIKVFIENNGLYEIPRNDNCYILTTGSINDFSGAEEMGLNPHEFTIYLYFPESIPPVISYAIKKCVDCRYIPGATKIKPDFWPNDHK